MYRDRTNGVAAKWFPEGENMPVMVNSPPPKLSLTLRILQFDATASSLRMGRHHGQGHDDNHYSKQNGSEEDAAVVTRGGC